MRMRTTARGLAFAAAAWAAAATGAAAQCPGIFADGQAPSIGRPRMLARSQPLCFQAFAVLDSGLTKGPLWSAEHLTAASVAGARAVPREGRFHDEERVAQADRASLEDYRGSGYDRGHMAPSGDMPTAASQQETFSLGNMVPQAPQLNRGVWEAIEEAVRAMAYADGDLYVVTGPAYASAKVSYIGSDRVLVPTATWKAIYDPRRGRAAVYVCTNVAAPRCTVHSLADLYAYTGVDAFPSLSFDAKTIAMDVPRPEARRYARDTQ